MRQPLSPYKRSKLIVLLVGALTTVHCVVPEPEATRAKTSAVVPITEHEIAGGSGDRFGESIGLGGDTVIVGAPWDGTKGDKAGAASVFVRSGASWALQQKLGVAEGTDGDWFGWSVAISGNTAVVGVPHDDDKGAISGSASVFVRSGTTWSRQQKLVASDGAADARFGWSVAIDGDTVVVGAPTDRSSATASGAAYVFVRSGASWSEEQKLLPGDPANNDWFGTSVAVSGDTVAIGSPHDDDKGESTGAVYVFTRSGGSWTEEQKLIGGATGGGSGGDLLGNAVSLSGDRLVASAYLDDQKGPDAGAVYAFERKGTVWSPTQKLVAADGTADAWFGYAVSLAGDALVVGAPTSPFQSAIGAAYHYTRDATGWRPRIKLSAAAGSGGNRFGQAVAAGRFVVAIGAPKDGAATQLGQAYVYTLGFAENGQSCSVEDDCFSGVCVWGHCCDRACGDSCWSCASGTCSAIPRGVDDTEGALTCRGELTCDGQGGCKKQLGSGCVSNIDCASGHCAETASGDWICCTAACIGDCQVCSAAGSCEPIPKGEVPEGGCLGTHPSCGTGSCDGQGKCLFPSTGLPCGSCRVCDSEGACAPPRCDGGAPDLGGDHSSSPDSGTTDSPAARGCSCDAGEPWARTAPTGWLLGVLLWAAARRWGASRSHTR